MDLLSCVIGVTFLLFSVQLHSVQGVLVPCSHRQEVCECPITDDDCTFELEIQELTTFTSYPLDNNGYLRDAPGTTYSVSDRGFTPSSDCLSGDCCFINPGITDSFFTNNMCSVPMTVDGDSGTPRKFIAVNGRIPGPTIIVKENQIVKVTVKNRLKFFNDLCKTTIHWHGMHQVNTEWMDGVGNITQRDIYCGKKFDYIFKATPPGTHWYHSHSGTQRTEGLFGSLIVLEKTNFFSQTVVPQINRVSTELNIDIIDMPSQHTLTLLDWYRENNKPAISGDYHSGLINGRGRLTSSTVTPLSVFNVVNGMDYRFRVIGAQNHFAFRLSIQNHDLHVIATDGNGNGTFITPITVDYLVVHSGERYDFIPKRTSQNTEFWIIAQKIDINNGMQMTNLTEDVPAVALLRYDTENAFDWTGLETMTNQPTCTGNQCKMLNCLTDSINEICIPWTELRPLLPSEIDSLPDITNFITSNNPSVLFNFAFEGGMKRKTASVNALSFKIPNNPYLCQQYDTDKKGNHETLCTVDDRRECVNVHKIEPSKANGQVIIFTALTRGGDRFAHPIHLHGHSFYILDVGFDATSRYPCEREREGDKSCRPVPTFQKKTVMGTYNTNGLIKDNFILKDTVVVPGGGYVVIAFQANNPGYWFLHCHIELHLSKGMALIVESHPYTEHTCPPEGINDANFMWDIAAYKRFVNQAAKCGANCSYVGANNGGDNGSRRGEMTFLLTTVVTIFLAL